MRAYDDVRAAMRHAGIKPVAVAVGLIISGAIGGADPPFLSPGGRRPARLSGLVGEHRARSTEYAGSPTWAAPPSATSPSRSPIRKISSSRVGETPRASERRDVVWGKYVNGQPTISKRAPSEHASCERSEPNRRKRVISDVAYSMSSTAESEEAFDRGHEVPHEALRARPIPRINIQAFCEDQDTAAVIEKASVSRTGASRRLTSRCKWAGSRLQSPFTKMPRRLT